MVKNSCNKAHSKMSKLELEEIVTRIINKFMCPRKPVVFLIASRIAEKEHEAYLKEMGLTHVWGTMGKIFDRRDEILKEWGEYDK